MLFMSFKVQTLFIQNCRFLFRIVAIFEISCMCLFFAFLNHCYRLICEVFLFVTSQMKVYVRDLVMQRQALQFQ